MENKKIALWVIAGALVLGLLVLTFFPGMVYAVEDFGKGDNSVEDKCSPAPGYTEESWREHMSHHPNVYKECL